VTPISVRDVVFGLVIIGLGVSLIQLGRSAQENQFESLSNAVTLLGVLYILFNFLTYVVTLLGWPVNGFLDVIANDVIAVAMGFVSWYFMRLAES
jgi:DMSO/TMAO reductase YedYZ heme-binding membrane subunit